MARENIERTKSQSLFRTVMDVGMGIFYVVIGITVIYMQSFGNLPMPAWVAWILGGMMSVGGVFRFIRGVKAFLPQKNTNDRISTE